MSILGIGGRNQGFYPRSHKSVTKAQAHSLGVGGTTWPSYLLSGLKPGSSSDLNQSVLIYGLCASAGSQLAVISKLLVGGWWLVACWLDDSMGDVCWSRPRL
jgi:hypothetical protein